MISEAIINLCKGLVFIIFDLIPNIPAMPESFISSIDYVIDLIFVNGINLLSVFVRVDTIKLAVPIAIVLVNLDKIYSLIMWVIKKIPFSID